jgi:hypothetical protein
MPDGPPPLAPQPPGPLSPDASGASALMQQMQQSDQKTQGLLGQEQKEMQGPTDAANSILAQPGPKAPQSEAQPSAPQMREQQAQNAHDFISSAILIAGIAGALSRSHVTTALNAFGATLKGFREGQLQDAQQAYTEFKNASEAVKANNEAMQRDYQNALADRKASLDEQMARVNMVAAKYHDPLMQQAASAKNYLLVGQLMERQSEAAQKNTVAVEKIIQQHTDMWTKAKMSAANNGFDLHDDGTISPQVSDPSASSQAATGEPLTQVAPGYGPSVARKREQIRQGAVQTIMNENPKMGPDQAGVELAHRQITYFAEKSSETQLIKMVGATQQAVGQLDFNVEQATKEMAKLPSTDLSPVINAIARGEQKWTGDPAYSGLFFYMQASANESARILSGGQASIAQLREGAREEAQKWANVNMTPAMWQEVSGAMKAEGQARLKTYQDAVVYQRNQNHLGSGPGGPSGGNEMHYDVQGNLVQ